MVAGAIAGNISREATTSSGDIFAEAMRGVGIVQSLIVTCRLHGIDPYTYLVDVLQRVAEHPASRVAELTPRLWKTLFAANPMRSDLHNLRR